jgi:hypothetical protein
MVPPDGKGSPEISDAEAVKHSTTDEKIIVAIILNFCVISSPLHNVVDRDAKMYQKSG